MALLKKHHQTETTHLPSLTQASTMEKTHHQITDYMKKEEKRLNIDEETRQERREKLIQEKGWEEAVRGFHLTLVGFTLFFLLLF